MYLFSTIIYLKIILISGFKQNSSISSISTEIQHPGPADARIYMNMLKHLLTETLDTIS